MKIRTLTIASAAMLLACTNALAIDYNCEGCTLGQMKSTAVSLGKGDHRIYSFSNGLAKRFSVTCQGDSPLGIPQPLTQSDGSDNTKNYTGSTSHSNSQPLNAAASTTAAGCPFNRPLVASIAPLAADEQYAFDLAKQWRLDYPSNDQGADLSYNTGTHPGNSPYGESVYNVLHDYPGRSMLFRDIQLDTPAITQFLSVIAAATVSHFNVLSNRIIISVTFRDGSSIRIVYDGNLQTFTLIPNTARNELNRPIIEQNALEYEGSYDMVGVDQNRYLQYLQSMGVQVIGGSGSSAGMKYVCSWDRSALRLTCRVF